MDDDKSKRIAIIGAGLPHRGSRTYIQLLVAMATKAMQESIIQEDQRFKPPAISMACEIDNSAYLAKNHRGKGKKGRKKDRWT